MKNALDQELKYLEDEILRLKTGAQKSAQSAELVVKTVTVNAPLELHNTPPVAPYANKYKLFEIVQDEPELTRVYLSWYYGDIFIAEEPLNHPREIGMRYCVLENGSMGIKLRFSGSSAGGANSDVQRMINGEQITLSVDMTIVSTGDFSIVERI